MEPECMSEADKVRPARRHNLFVHLMLFASLYLAYLILQSFLDPILFAAVLAFLCEPLRVFYSRKFPGKRNLATFLVVLTAALTIAVPLLILLAALVAEGVKSVSSLQEWLQAGGLEALLHHPWFDRISQWAKETLPFGAELDVNAQLLTLSRKVGEVFLNQGAGLAADAVKLAVKFLALFFVMFYMVRDGRQMLGTLKSLLPLEEGQSERILDRIGEMSKSVFVGTFLTAVCQGLVGGIGLALVGIPGLFWGAAMGVVSLIPLVGTALVWVPAVGYLLLTGRYGGALFLLIWCVGLVGTVDNFIRPFLMRGGGGLSTFYVFLAVMGGLDFFGLPGLLYGPLILTFAAAVLQLYREEFPAATG